jgi:hypothetical protein
VALVREGTIPTELPLLFGEVSANFCVSRGQWADPYGRILYFLDQSRYFLFQVVPHVYSWAWVDPVPYPLLFKKSDSAGNLTRTFGSVARNYDH